MFLKITPETGKAFPRARLLVGVSLYIRWEVGGGRRAGTFRGWGSHFFGDLLRGWK